MSWRKTAPVQSRERWRESLKRPPFFRFLKNSLVSLEKKGALNLREEFETDGIRVKDRNRGGSVRVFPDLKEKTKQRT